MTGRSKTTITSLPRVYSGKVRESYAVGDRVVHASFGVGKVTALDGNKIIVDFPLRFTFHDMPVGTNIFALISTV